MNIKETSGQVQNIKDKRKTNKGCWLVAGIGCAVMILLVGALVALVVILAASSSDLGTSIEEDVLFEGSEGKIVVIRVEGLITESGLDGGLLGGAGVSSDSIMNQIDKAVADENVSAILLRINSPGGEVVASDLVFRKVMEAREIKPVVSWMSGSGASGAYLIAAGSDTIVSHPSSITASIGCILELSN
ncbi:MAG: S49 family peptidase, partial [Patescibacteria group bacterium]|nr:S49 family peptidase [Patescibacteria group bacterium]